MAKKEKVVFQHPEELEAVEAELSAAMELLDTTNERVTEVLRACAPPPPADAAPPADDAPPVEETDDAASSAPAHGAHPG